jgi:hypothetical protein
LEDGKGESDLPRFAIMIWGMSGRKLGDRMESVCWSCESWMQEMWWTMVMGLKCTIAARAVDLAEKISEQQAASYFSKVKLQ